MSNITDKELLAICNLSNLKMEFANLKRPKKVQENSDEEILSNHTIYSLLDKEINSIQKRNKLRENSPTINKQRITEGDYENLKKIYVTQGENISSSTKQLYLEQTLLRAEEEQYRVLMTEGECLGAFYNTDEFGKKENIYNLKEELRKIAPIVMEYFDRYRESGKDSKHEGAFLDDWEIIYSADLYQMIIDCSYELYYELYKEYSNILKGTEKILSKEEFIESNKIPSRDKIKNTNNIIKIIDILKDIFVLGKYQNINLENIL